MPGSGASKPSPGAPVRNVSRLLLDTVHRVAPPENICPGREGRRANTERHQAYQSLRRKKQRRYGGPHRPCTGFQPRRTRVCLQILTYGCKHKYILILGHSTTRSSPQGIIFTNISSRTSTTEPLLLFFIAWSESILNL